MEAILNITVSSVSASLAYALSSFTQLMLTTTKFLKYELDVDEMKRRCGLQ